MIQRIITMIRFGVMAGALAVAFPAMAHEADLRVSSPTEGQVINSDQVDVQITAPEFTIMDNSDNPANVHDQGHANLWLDETEMTADTAVAYTDSSAPYTFFGLEPGTHTLVVELVQNDGTPLEPSVKKTVTFTTTQSSANEILETTADEDVFDADTTGADLVAEETTDSSADLSSGSASTIPISQTMLFYAGAIILAALVIGVVLGSSISKKK